ncbi:MAG: nucleoside recognition domain-containing protein [Thermodesulfobacteriota bacterium]
MLLNMWDEAKSRGIVIDLQTLSNLLGVSVLKTVATRRKGLDKIKESLWGHPPSSLSIPYPEAIEDGVSKIIPLLPEASISKRSLALMLLSGDESLGDWLHHHLSEREIQQIEKIRHEIQGHLVEPIGYLINQARLRKVDELLSQVMGLRGVVPKTIATFLGNLSIHPFWGIPILLLILYLTYQSVGVFGAQTAVKFLEETVFGKWLLPPIIQFTQRFIPFPLVQELFIGPYGIITMALTYAIAIVLPIVGCFFLVFGLMEDSGYLPRLAVMTHRIFRKMGLSGKAILPMVLGLGCGTMATMTTRILETEKDRTLATLLLALGVPCSAQLGVILGMFSNLPAFYFILWVIIMIGVLMFVGYLGSRILPGESSDFVLEIPPLRIPMISNLMVKTLARIEWYLREAVPLFVLGTLLLFILHKTKGLTLIEWVATPLIVHFLSLPSKVTEAFIIGFLRRDYGAAGLFMLSKQGQLDPHQTLVSLVTITLFIPCIAQFLMMAKERGLVKALWISFVVIPIAIGVGGMVNFLLRPFGV